MKADVAEIDAPPPPAAPAIAAVGGSETLAPLWVDAAGAARLCGLSRSQWLSLDADGRVPAPKDFGAGKVRRCPRWNVEELRVWSRLGAPPRGRWGEMRDQPLRQAMSGR